ncbi:MAG: 23S rRNA (adenine(2503)-C(2))-methyltransferase RlmN [Nitrospirota bacterium]|nr:23S rRNA (adenine(2503)-C(2))-methyltransferase RlmN [Nitrospirota bacterium]MDE3242030.1 23S rRNA (adenine(2503)-C(2))-methyltransferase RlmN [Nitrospirota bacterium]
MPVQPPTPNPSPREPLSLLALNGRAAEQFVQRLGWPPYRAQQILRWLYQGRVREVAQMTDLSKAERALLNDRTTVGRSRHCRVLQAEDGTRKFLIGLEDGLTVEAVLIPDGSRLTLCLSTQVGCTLDCTFCLTGTMGLKRNLKAHEIVDQVLTVQDRLEPNTTLSSLVLMGMGEPLANLDAVADAIARLTNHRWGVGISAHRITLSTAGLASRLNEVAGLGVNLAISLNASNQEQRAHLMPAVNRLHPLRTLLEACRAYPLPPRRRLTFEYVLLGGVNDQEPDAKRLVKLLAGIRCKVNLIPFNPFPGSPYQRPADRTVLRFQTILKQAGVDTFIRKSKGRDVLGACGQLGHLPDLITPDPIPLALTPAEAGC